MPSPSVKHFDKAIFNDTRTFILNTLNFNFSDIKVDGNDFPSVGVRGDFIAKQFQ